MTKEQLSELITRYHTHADILAACELDAPIYTDVAVCEIIKQLMFKILDHPSLMDAHKEVMNIIVQVQQIQIEMQQKFNTRGEGENV